ncbi:MAG: glutathione S-transferase family protein [Inquilinus limosus]|uniref:Glutathione S-transferase family protein n=1 Tax=Inquilinus limosus TaxID=171674 RepID=A0A952FLY0_9PROT|nr:glutathione S-transferase family protein [Inquilinus limosus]
MSSPSPQLRLWGRVNSVNVQKVLWCLQELDLPYERIDAGMQFGLNTEPAYLAMNPNGKVPLLADGDYVLWESNAIIRYLARQYGEGGTLYPPDPKIRGGIDRWLDWSLSTLQPAERPVFWGLVRTPPAERDMAAIREAADAVAALWGIVDRHLAGRRFLEGEVFTLADIVLGAYARRWFGIEGMAKPELPQLQRWHARLAEREGYRRFVAPPLT